MLSVAFNGNPAYHVTCHPTQPGRPVLDLPARRDGRLSWPWCWLRIC